MSIWLSDAPLVLASKSSARSMLLANAGLAFKSLPADVDERQIEADAGLVSPAELASLLAVEKACAVSRLNPDAWVIGADQTLALDDLSFHKPSGREQAAAQIAQLAGRTHQLNSAVAVARGGITLYQHVSVARMTMRLLDDMQIANYLDAAGPVVTTSVGAYQLEGLGIHLFEAIDGDHFTILGLPLTPLLDFFRREKLLAI